MNYTLTQPQKLLIGLLIPFVGTLVVILLPIPDWDTRFLYMAIFVAVLSVAYIEILIFGLEDNLRRLGKSFVIAFPVVAIAISALIAARPAVRSDYSGIEEYEQAVKEVFLARQAQEEKAMGEFLGKLLPGGKQQSEHDQKYQEVKAREKENKSFSPEPSLKSDRSDGVLHTNIPLFKPSVYLSVEDIGHIEAALKAKGILPKRTIVWRNPIDRWTAPYWLALLLFVGVIEFRLFSRKN